jgi:DNA-binding NtrC family response regulator
MKLKPEDHKKGHLLIVDDDKETLETIAEYFSDSFCVEIAQTDYDAWNILTTKKIDCVFCDINLGSRSGLDLLKKCKAFNVNTPFVVFSGSLNKENMINAIRLGAIHVLEKPLDLNYLKNQVATFIESGRDIQKIKKEMNSVVRVVSPTDEKNMKFVEDYLIHAQMYKQKQKKTA